MAKIKEIVSLAQQLQASIDVDEFNVLGIRIDKNKVVVQLAHKDFLKIFESYETDSDYYSDKGYFHTTKTIEGIIFTPVFKAEEILDTKKDHSAK